VSIVLVTPDLQAPFQHQDSLEFLSAVDYQFKCDEWINIGDEMDFHTLSVSHQPDVNGMSFSEEYNEAMKFFAKMYKRFPRTKVCVSNHTVRPLKKAWFAGIPSVFLRSYEEFMKAPPGWKWAQSWEVDGVKYEHGEGVAGQNGHIKCATENRQSTVIGHLHSFAGINYINNPKKEMIFGFNVGCLINMEAYAFHYGQHWRKKPTLGCGVIANGTPHFIPLKLDKRDRWTGKL
jgi:hypothetical protein